MKILFEHVTKIEIINEIAGILFLHCRVLNWLNFGQRKRRETDGLVDGQTVRTHTVIKF